MELEKIMTEKEQKPVTVDELERMVYGDESSKISLDKYRDSAEYDAEIDARFWEIIEKAQARVEVTEEDDGCIDGRWTVKVIFNDGGEVRVSLADNTNHERPKVAGGGYITSLAMRLGAGLRSSSLDTDVTVTGETLASHKVYCGAHNADPSHVHAEGGTGCGANDELPLILHNALAYRDGVRKTTEALLAKAGVVFDETVFDSVLGNWEETLSDNEYFGDSTGASRLQRVVNLQVEQSELNATRKPVGVTKELGGAHKEIAIVANYEEGTTISQGTIAQLLTEKAKEIGRDATTEQFIQSLPQAFVVDAWRIVKLAGAAVEENDTLTAIYAGVMYQVATAATLTDGSLRIFSYTPEK